MDDPYEPPVKPEIVLRPADGDPAAMAMTVLAEVHRGREET